MNYRCFHLVLAVAVLTAIVPELRAQDTTFHLSPSLLIEEGVLRLPPVTQWKFKKGSDTSWAAPTFDDGDWLAMDSATIRNLEYDDDGRFEGWFRLQFRLDSSFKEHPCYIKSMNLAAQDLYLDGKLVHSFGQRSSERQAYKTNSGTPIFLNLQPNKDYHLALHFSDEVGPWSRRFRRIYVMGVNSFLFLMTPTRTQEWVQQMHLDKGISEMKLVAIGIITFLFWLIWAFNRSQKNLFMIALFGSAILFNIFTRYLDVRWINSELVFLHAEASFFFLLFGVVGTGLCMTTLNLLLAAIFLEKVPRWFRLISYSFVVIFAPAYALLYDIAPVVRAVVPVTVTIIVLSSFIYLLAKAWNRMSKVMWPIIVGLGLTILLFTIPLPIYLGFDITLNRVLETLITHLTLLIFPFFLLIYIALWFKETQASEQQKAMELSKVTAEKQAILVSQNERLELQVSERTHELNQSLENLKATQSQLIHSEKMASLGELTAGIAHEIQNPLNFVNNFSDLNKELADELEEEAAKGNIDEVKQLAKDIADNESKINHHGKRAEEIVKSMLQHSRGTDGEKELTDINVLAEEYIRLAYHGLRAKDKSFNADFKLDLDPELPQINVVPQDIGRVLLNLINNAFQAVAEKSRASQNGYLPTVELTTRLANEQIEIHIQDNGPGIGQEIKDKIFQPFFTTKATGQGTGLGLSMSYDIITKGHQGTIEVDSGNSHTTFIISIPTQQKIDTIPSN